MFSKMKVGSLVLAGMLVFGAAAYADTGAARYDGQIQAAVTKQLQKPEFKQVRASVQDGIVTLQGTVDTYKHKLDAQNKVRKQDHVQGVRNELQVAGVNVPDTELRDRLARQLRYNRYGYGSVFDVLTVGVNDGVVTLGGEVWNPVDRESALGIVENMPGVKGVVDQVKVAPTSIYDDHLRRREVRAIYGDPALAQYGLDPQRPIRILVNNGHVSLYGMVDNKMDSQIAYMRASQVFGAFSVANHLQVAKNPVG